MATIAETLNLALQHHEAGRLQEAEALYRQILHDQPDHPDALHLLGVIAHHAGRHDVAVELIGKAITANPMVADYHNNLGEAYRAQDKLKEAMDCYRQALVLRPAYAEARNNMGTAFQAQGMLEEAASHYRQALALKPDFALAHNNLGTVLYGKGQLEEAAGCYRQALVFEPDFAFGHNNLGNVLHAQGKVKDAMACYRKALAIKPDYVTAHSNLLMIMSYDPECDPKAVAEEHRIWNDAHARTLVPQTPNYPNSCEESRRLRVGYVSADFCGHPASFFIEPLLSAHDHEKVEVFLYSNGMCPEAMIGSLRKLADAWRNIVGLSDEAVSDLIRADGIDILVDLSSHTQGNRLLVFARKPAPVQVAYGGSAMTTGLTTMDYRLTDRFLSPPDSPEWSSEELIRMPDVVACYSPPVEAPAVSSLPALANGYVTFSCFNNLVKVTPRAVALWSRILRALPEARFIMKDRALADTTQRARYLGLFRDNGIEAERIELLLRTPMAEYLATYGRVDIALDPFPYNGCTTTCEALWMGVPAVTLAGVLANGRVGVTLLANVGLSRLIATTPEEYVRIAVELATDRQALALLRAELRSRMAASPLCDAKALANGVEEAYRLMWRRWCRSQQ